MLKNEVVRKKGVFCSVLLILALVPINLIFKDVVVLWSLSLIPTILLVQAFPKWKTGILSLLGVIILEVSTEHFIFGHLTKEMQLNIIVNCIVNTSITLLVTHLRVKNVNLLLTDPLTGAYNKRFYNLFLSSDKNNKDMAVQVIDIDHFKKVNDTYGHDCGDFIISKVAEKITEIIRKTDKLVRIGGEEFIVFSPETNEIDMKKISNRICKQIEDSNFMYEGQLIDITVSIGVSKKIEKSQNLESIVKKADEALYLSKNNGRNQVSFNFKFL